MTGPKLTVINALACDDVRKEVTGKDILIGVYQGGGVLVPKFPADINLTFYVQWEPADAGEAKAEMRVVTGEEAVLLEGEVTVKAVRKAASSFHFGPMAIPVLGPASFSLQFRQDTKVWQTLMTVSVRAREPKQVEQPADQSAASN
jgi:hypothetical protein